MMVERGNGIIVNISSAGGLGYFLNTAYGVGKCAQDRMAQGIGFNMFKKPNPTYDFTKHIVL